MDVAQVSAPLASISLHTIDISGTTARLVRDSTGKIWCVYVSGNSLMCRTSSDNGYSWTAEETIVTESYAPEHDLVIDSSDVPHVVYAVRTGTASEITMYYTNRSGGTWAASVDIFGGTAYYKYPKIAIDSSDDIHCVYHKGTIAAASCRYVTRVSSTATWGAEVNLATKTSRDQESQDICVDSLDNLHVVYAGATLSRDLHYMLNDGSWQAEETVAGFSDATNWQLNPAVLVDSSDVVHIFWTGKNYGTTNPTVSQLCHIEGNTGAWGTIEVITDVTQPQGEPYGMDASIDGADNLHLAWSGARWSAQNLAWITVQHRRKVGSSWDAVEVVADYNISRTYDLLWGAHPADDIISNGYVLALNTEGNLKVKRSIF